MTTRFQDGRRGLLLVMMDVEKGYDEELNRWYDEEHLPERAACPGFLTARRFVALDGEPKYLALYDLEHPSVLETPAYKKIFPPSVWTRQIDQHVTREVRNVYVEITPRLKAIDSGSVKR